MAWNNWKRYRAFFFDFDGTLVDSLPILKKVYFDFMKSVGKEGSEEEFEKLNGPNIKEIVSYLHRRYEINDSENEIRDLFRSLCLSLYSTKVDFFPGAAQFLEDAKEKGIRLYVVTSAEPALVERVFDRTQKRPLLDGIVSSTDFQNGKPHPEVYLRALIEADLNSEDVLAFEDSKNGILAATRAGIQTVAFGTGQKVARDDVHQIVSWDDAAALFEEGTP